MANWAEQLREQPEPQRQPANKPVGKWSEIIRNQQVQPDQDVKPPSGAGGSYDETRTWIDTLKSAVVNVPSSASNYGKAIYQAVTSPKETGKALWGLAKEIRYSNIHSIQEEDQNNEKWTQVAKFMYERYGSVSRFKNTLAIDPVGTLSDVASVIMPVGKIGGVKTLTKIGASLEPTNIALRAAKLPFRLIPENATMQLYQSAVKFGTTLTAKQRKAVTMTALKFDVMPHNKGMEKLGESIWKYNNEITAKVEAAGEKGHLLNIKDAYKGLDKIREEFKRTSSEPLKWNTAFNGLQEQLKEHLKSGPNRTPQEIQKLKQTIYQELQSFYEQHKSSPAKVIYKKQIAKSAKEMLETIIPEIKSLNKNEGALIDLFKAIESKANRITNRDLIGIGLPIKMGAGAGIGFMFAGETGGQLGTKLGFLMGVFDMPQVKAKLAITLNRLRQKGVQVRPTTAAIKLGLFQSGREKE